MKKIILYIQPSQNGLDMSNLFDSAFFSIFLSLATIIIGLPGLYYAIPQSKGRKVITITTIFVIITLINTGYYFSSGDKELAVKNISIYSLIIMGIASISIMAGYITAYLNKEQFSRYAHLPMPKSQKLSYGLDHLDNKIMSHYSALRNPTLKDKKEAMAAILRQISLTTAPSNLKNLIRMGVFEVRADGKFRVLAVHQIDLHRIPEIERTFSWKKEKGVSIVGLAVNRKEAVLFPDLSKIEPKDREWYKKTDENRYLFYQTRSILCVPVFEKDINAFPDAKCLAVISISSSVPNELKVKHKKEVEEYASRARNLLMAINKHVIFDPEIHQNKIRAITISGEVGSGKSTLVAELHGLLKSGGWSVVSIGEKFREFCKNEGISVEQIEQIAPEIHKKFDDYQKIMLEKEDYIIVDGRLSGYLAKDLPDVLTVFCDLPLKERTNRVADRETNLSMGKEEIESKITSRDKKDLERYNKIYDIKDYRDREYYKYYLDMSGAPFELAKMVIYKMNEFNRD